MNEKGSKLIFETEKIMVIVDSSVGDLKSKPEEFCSIVAKCNGNHLIGKK